MNAFDNPYRHVRKRLIMASLAVALLLDFVPLPLPWGHWLPEFTALMMLFWLLQRPELVGISMAFILGLLLDIGSGASLGQHALAFTVAAYMVQRKQRQIQLYAFGLQAAAILAALLLIQALLVLVFFFQQHQFAGWGMLASPFVGALLWPLLNTLMLALAQFRRP